MCPDGSKFNAISTDYDNGCHNRDLEVTNPQTFPLITQIQVITWRHVLSLWYFLLIILTFTKLLALNLRPPVQCGR